MILVPRQLERAGLTGNVPYYGGRFTPAQAYAASHPRPAAPASPPPSPPPPAPSRAASHEPSRSTHEALEHLRDAGVITAEEYQQIRDRAAQ
jgi:hypothetical protein